MDMKMTHVQYKKALQEKVKGTKMEECQQNPLGEAIAGLEKELDKSGNWLAQFVDKVMKLLHLEHFQQRGKERYKYCSANTSWMYSPFSSPTEVKVLGLTVDAAKKEEKDVEKQYWKVAHAMMAEARTSTYIAWELVDEFAEKDLG
ncbi:hypothetical protein BKA83DRAFT_4131309 [Pisolithus microcarpus]|nr:hypothetical protein BKA83DRAFT_4131309 [Pisolithus microcarpus]